MLRWHLRAASLERVGTAKVEHRGGVEAQHRLVVNFVGY